MLHRTPSRTKKDFSRLAAGSAEGVAHLFRHTPQTSPETSPSQSTAALFSCTSTALPAPLPRRLEDTEPVERTLLAPPSDVPVSSPLVPATAMPATSSAAKGDSLTSESSDTQVTSTAPPRVPQLAFPDPDSPAVDSQQLALDSGRSTSVDSETRLAARTPTSVAANQRAKRLPSRRKKATADDNAAGGPRYRAFKLVAWLLQALLTLVYVVASGPAKFFGAVVSRFTERVYEKRQLQRLRAIMEATEDHTTWDDTAKELDELQGYAEWSTKRVELTKEYCEPDMLDDETTVIAKLAATEHDPSIASYIQTALHRDLYGCTQAPLYRYYRGTKVFVGQYVSAVVQLVEEFAEMPAARDAVAAAQEASSARFASCAASPVHAVLPHHTSESLPACGSAGSHHTASPSTMPRDHHQQLSPTTMPQSSGGTSPSMGMFPAVALGTTAPGAGPMLGCSDMSAMPPPLLSGTAEPMTHAPLPMPVPRPIARADLAAISRADISAECGPQLRRLVEIAERAAIADAEALNAEDSDSQGPSDGRPLRAERMSLDDKIATLETALRSFGRSALLLSGGAALGMYHSGTVRALWNEGLLPRIMCGSSAGAIIASIFCTRTDEEVNRLCNGKAGNLLDGMTLHAFELEKDLRHAKSLMDVKTLMHCLQENVGDETFLAAYQRTGRILNVSIAAEGREGDKSMVLNYVTAPNVVIWSGVAASCAMPGLFSAVQLLKKNERTGELEQHLPGQLWFDGSVPCDLPKQRLAELFNCNYFIVSQANPHVVPFLPKPPSNLVNKKRTAVTKRVWMWATHEMKYWLLKFYRHHLLPRSGAWELPYLMCNQSFTGDVTIRPIGSVIRALPDFINLTSNPTQRHMEYVVSNAQRQTWPYLLQIQYATEVERCLLRCIADLRQRKLAEQQCRPAFVPSAPQRY